jgi:uncharacterized protein (TIGR02231 family)
MKRWLFLSSLFVVAAGLGVGSTAFFAKAEAKKDAPAPPAADEVKTATSRITQVTVYPSNALVTREVEVPAGTGVTELVVTPLPPMTVNSSLYSEGAEGILVLATRFRTRPVQQDTREEVRKLEAQLREKADSIQKLQADLETAKTNLALLGKLEAFTAAGAQHTTDKGTLNGDTVITLTKYVMDSRAEKAKEMVGIQQQIQATQEEIEYTKRKLQEMSAGSSKTERDAVIVVDKKNAAPGKVRLNYLVDAASWHPQYKLRAGKEEKEAIQVEYLAAVMQQSGEDWRDVNLILSTAQPMMNAAPPDLKMLDVAVVPKGNAANPMEMPANPAAQADNFKQAKSFRGQAQQEYAQKKEMSGSELINKASALEQTNEFLWISRDDLQKNRNRSGQQEGQSVTYHLDLKLTVPSRSDEQVLEVAKLPMEPEYFYKAVPVLTQHVYRLANLTNKSKYVLLPGEATMYLGADFVGRMDLPLVAIGEQFTAGFGVDPQLQVQRQLLDKTRSTQGGNQVLKYDYRILISSYKSEPVTLQLWERLPHAENETVGVTLGKIEPEVSSDPLYQREQRPNNLLRWDLKVEPNVNGEKAKVVKYDFKMELDRQMTIGSFQTK